MKTSFNDLFLLEEKDRILFLIERDNYRQIFYDFSIEHVLKILNYFEEVEDFDTCAIILKEIESIKRTTGENYPTHL